MLILSRKVNETVVVGDGIRITIVDIRGDKVRLGIEADRSVPVDRLEIHERKRKEAAA